MKQTVSGEVRQEEEEELSPNEIDIETNRSLLSMTPMRQRPEKTNFKATRKTPKAYKKWSALQLRWLSPARDHLRWDDDGIL